MGHRRAHEHLRAELARLTEADNQARAARRDADRAATEASRALSRSEADRNIAAGKLESQSMAVARHTEAAMSARTSLAEAEAGIKDLPDLDAARAEVEDVKLTVEAARMTMMARRSALDELRRDGEARARRAPPRDRPRYARSGEDYSLPPRSHARRPIRYPLRLRLSVPSCRRDADPWCQVSVMEVFRWDAILRRQMPSWQAEWIFQHIPVKLAPE